MKIRKSILLVIVGSFFSLHSFSQNVLINILTQNSGIISKGGKGFLEITICNTDPIDSVPVYKLRPQISFPSSIARIPESGHILPAGWAVISNDGSTVRLSNGTDMIPANVCRTILIAIEGKETGGPSTISGSLLFSNGVAPGSFPGAATRNDNPADNNSTSTCKVDK